MADAAKRDGGLMKIILLCTKKIIFCMQKYFLSFCLIDLSHKHEGVTGQDADGESGLCRESLIPPHWKPETKHNTLSHTLCPSSIEHINSNSGERTSHGDHTEMRMQRLWCPRHRGKFG